MLLRPYHSAVRVHQTAGILITPVAKVLPSRQSRSSFDENVWWVKLPSHELVHRFAFMVRVPSKLVLRVRQRGRQVRSAKKMVRGYLHRSVCVASVGISRSPGAAAARRQSLRGSALPARRTCSESLASACTTPQETVTKNAKRHRSN